MAINRPFTIKIGSNGDKLFYRLSPVIDLTSATVTFSMRPRNVTTPKIDQVAAQVANGTYIIDGVSFTYVPTDGVVFYDWPGANDLDTAGEFESEWNITKAGKSFKRPSQGYEIIIVSEDVPL